MLVEHLGEGEVAYMIPDDMLYNPGHLRNCDLPNHALDGKLPDSFSVPGTHYFPTGFFDARYVVTADPFPLSLAPDTELGHRFNAVFLQLRETTHQQVATFDMGNGTVFTIWERTTPVTREEVETYLHEFDAENAKYPEMFSAVVETGWLFMVYKRRVKRYVQQRKKSTRSKIRPVQGAGCHPPCAASFRKDH